MTKEHSSSLKVLDLAWNALHGEGAEARCLIQSYVFQSSTDAHPTDQREALLEGIYDNNKAADARNSGGLRRLGIAWNRVDAQKSC